MKKIIFILFLFVFKISIAQEDWKIPKVKGKFQMEFNSKQINTGKKKLCEIYFATKTTSDLSTKLTAAMMNGKVKFWSASSFGIIPQMSGADANTGDMTKYVYSMMNKCKPNSPDTLFGSITIDLTQVKALSASRGGTVKALFRIILKEKEYNIKFRGFEYSYYETGSAFKPGKMVVKDLEEEYNETEASRADKKYWADIKIIVKLFNDTLEEVLSSQASDFNFDD